MMSCMVLIKVSGVSREDEEESVAQFTCYQCMCM